MNRLLFALAQRLMPLASALALLPLHAQEKPQAFIGARIIPVEGGEIE